MDVAEISDRLEIESLIRSYAQMYDQHRWDEFEALFVPDAICDFRSGGHGICSPAQLRRLLESPDPRKNDHRLLVYSQHVQSNSLITLDGDQAQARTELVEFRMRRIPGPPGDRGMFSINGGWYDDEFIRSRGQWRFKGRKITAKYRFVHDVQLPAAGAIIIPQTEPYVRSGDGFDLWEGGYRE
jgi:SnoaL-like domain